MLIGYSMIYSLIIHFPFSTLKLYSGHFVDTQRTLAYSLIIKYSTSSPLHRDTFHSISLQRTRHDNSNRHLHCSMLHIFEQVYRFRNDFTQVTLQIYTLEVVPTKEVIYL